ncbi:MAG: sialidase family protein [Pseudomonadota bacterium]
MRIVPKDSFTIYENPAPLLVSRQAVFPGLIQFDDGELLAMFSIGQAFDAADMLSYTSRSVDGGQSWSSPEPMFRRRPDGRLESESFKPLLLPDGTLIATGYVFERPDALTPIVNPETFEILPLRNKVSVSRDRGRTWTEPEVFSVEGKPLELSGPAILLASGRLLAAAAPFHLGKDNHAGWIIASDDGGQSWQRLSVFYRSPNGNVAPWECRLCNLDDEKVAVLFWAYDAASQCNLTNHITVSSDGGESFELAIATGIKAQASNLLPLGPDRLLSIHCHRENPVSLTVRVLRMLVGSVAVESECALFTGSALASRTDDIAQQFGSLKFGQPSLLRVSDNQVIAAWWQVENCQHIIKGRHLVLD